MPSYTGFDFSDKGFWDVPTAGGQVVIEGAGEVYPVFRPQDTRRDFSSPGLPCIGARLVGGLRAPHWLQKPELGKRPNAVGRYDLICFSTLQNSSRVMCR